MAHPEQDFHPVAAAEPKYHHHASFGRKTQLGLRHRGQTVMTFAELHPLPGSACLHAQEGASWQSRSGPTDLGKITAPALAPPPRPPRGQAAIGRHMQNRPDDFDLGHPNTRLCHNRLGGGRRLQDERHKAAAPWPGKPSFPCRARPRPCERYRAIKPHPRPWSHALGHTPRLDRTQPPTPPRWPLATFAARNPLATGEPPSSAHFGDELPNSCKLSCRAASPQSRQVETTGPAHRLHLILSKGGKTAFGACGRFALTPSPEASAIAWPAAEQVPSASRVLSVVSLQQMQRRSGLPSARKPVNRVPRLERTCAKGPLFQ